MDEIDISQANKAEILAALYNQAQPQGMGFMHHTPTDMTTEEAQEILDTGQTYFDYVQGRVMKVDLGKDILWTGLYDRDNGHGAAYRAIQHLIPASKETA